MAATGLAAIGPEYPVIAVRLWLVRDTPTYDKADVWKRAQTVTLFEHAAAYAFFAIGGGFVGQCIGNWGDLVSGVIGNAFASGATKDVREDKKKRDHELHRQGFLERWDHDSRQHDELKRSGNNCSPLESALVYNSDIASSADVDDLSHVRVVEADAERRGGHDSGRVRTREPPVDDRCFFLLRAEIVRIRRAAP